MQPLQHPSPVTPFAFPEYENVEPTNNSAERALHPVVLQDEISGQIKGGPVRMNRHG